MAWKVYRATAQGLCTDARDGWTVTGSRPSPASTPPRSRRDIVSTCCFSPGNLRRCLDDLVWQLGSDIAQAADDGLAGEAQQPIGVPPVLFEVDELSCRLDCLGQICPEGRRLLWSQIHGLGADVLVSCLKRAPRDHVHSDAQ
jgi:hypothetical protein